MSEEKDSLIEAVRKMQKVLKAAKNLKATEAAPKETKVEGQTG